LLSARVAQKDLGGRLTRKGGELVGWKRLRGLKGKGLVGAVIQNQNIREGGERAFRPPKSSHPKTFPGKRIFSKKPPLLFSF